MWSACWADGRATITTEASSTIMSWESAITASDHHRRGSGSSVSAVPIGLAMVSVISASSELSIEVASCPLRSALVVFCGERPGSGSIIGAIVPFEGILYGTVVPFVNALLGADFNDEISHDGFRR